MNVTPQARRLALLGLLLLLAGGCFAAYQLWPRSTLPGPDTPVYQEYLRAFQVGVAALDTTRTDLAGDKLNRAIELIPGEPAAWADRGLLFLRQGDLARAAADLRRAKELAPESGAIEALLGHLAERQGKLPEAVAHFRAAVEHDPRDVAALHALAEAVSKEAGPGSDAEYQRLLERILEVMPSNLPVLGKRARVAWQRHDLAAVRDTLARFDRLAAGWSDQSRKQLAEVHQALDTAPANVPLLLVRLANVLQGERGYSRDFAAVQPQPDFVGTPVQRFLRLPPPRPTPAPPDREMTFAIGPLESAGAGVKGTRWDVVVAAWRLSAEQRGPLIPGSGGVQAQPARDFKADIFVAKADALRRADTEGPALEFPGGAPPAAPAAAGVLAFDWDNDYRVDLLLAGAGGLRFWHRQPDGSLVDVTAKTGLPAAVLGYACAGAWAADVERDGDLDAFVARRDGPPLLLRNNRDGTFQAVEIKEFAAVRGARGFAWADLDNDGTPDAVFLDADGKLHVFANERFGQFSAWPLPADMGKCLAVTIADVNDDGVFDLVVLRDNGTLLRISDQEHRTSWQVAELARGARPKDAAPGAVALFVEDLDNNGAPDVVVAGPHEAHIVLGDEHFRFQPLPDAVPVRVFAVLDLNADGRLDLLGLAANGAPVRALNEGHKGYRAHAIWTLANPKAGDGRINSFAIDGEVEIRAGELVHKQAIRSPVTHFGLGAQPSVAVIRIVWPSGAPQWEFELPDGPLIVAAQRLTGSCPFLFTFDGQGMRFAGDFMWGTPLGMYVNGQNTTGFEQTTEWLKIRGEHLVPKEGYYDVRVHANLWETDYFDQLALLVVDHPPDTDIHVDERFFLTPTPPKLYLTTPARPVARAWDHHGVDATELVAAIDGRYLDRCGRGPFQGVSGDHWVEVELGEDVPADGPVYLIARGWIHPTDSSINVALAQGKHDAPRGLVLEVPDGQGGWKVGRPALGFPAGKDKTVLIRLDGIDGPGISRRFRLRTNMEIFWDFLGCARGLDAKLARVQRPAPLSAELRYRGIVAMVQKDASSPEVPIYSKVISTGQPWRDLAGYYTRFGDVRELLARVDDRYAIVNAGDEIALRFPVPGDPPAGWKRDFIWECDGWTRDGNPNTRYSTTVLPLPAHGGKGSGGPPGALHDDPVYRLFPHDWATYHTRYVSPDRFEKGLRTFRRPGAKD